jgi:hypothetical protein
MKSGAARLIMCLCISVMISGVCFTRVEASNLQASWYS